MEPVTIAYIILELYGLWEQLLTYKIWLLNFQIMNTLHQLKKEQV